MAVLMQIVGSIKDTLQKIIIRGEYAEYKEDWQMHCDARLFEMSSKISNELHFSVRFLERLLVEEKDFRGAKGNPTISVLSSFRFSFIASEDCFIVDAVSITRHSRGCSPLISMTPTVFLLDLANGNMNDISLPFELEDKVHLGNSGSETRNAILSPSVVHEINTVIATAVILEVLWWQSDVHSPNDLQDQTGGLFFIAVFWAFFPVFIAIFTFAQERAILKKERARDMYKLSAYFMARTSDLPLDILLPLLFLLFVYFMVGWRPTGKSFFLTMLLTMLIVFLCIVAAQACIQLQLQRQELGPAIGDALMDLKKATTLASVTVMAFMLAGGYFMKVNYDRRFVGSTTFDYVLMKLMTHDVIILLVEFGGVVLVYHQRRGLWTMQMPPGVHVG
ncbi:hypothetical protein L6452_24428 [Arctium lappa]|uniref:Uncharacterized protein n=1 Tax=Arctium lappa TaxID=4217 RepID=A0ACB9A9R0_ARCLA|nr:hypothetical protein L6452_24428 [Arctium lappa]